MWAVQSAEEDAEGRPSSYVQLPEGRWGPTSSPGRQVIALEEMVEAGY